MRVPPGHAADAIEARWPTDAGTGTRITTRRAQIPMLLVAAAFARSLGTTAMDLGTSPKGPGSGSRSRVDGSSSLRAVPDMYRVYVVRAGGREVAMTQHRDDTEGLSASEHSVAETGDDLDLLLAASAPDVSAASPERSRALGQMVAATGRTAGAGATRRRALRAAAIAGAGALVLGGAGAAAATSGAWVPPWDREPAAEFSFTLPSGTQCAEHVDSIEMKQGSSRTAQDVEDYMAREHLTFHLSESDIVAAARGITGAGSATISSDGTVTETSHTVDPNALNDADYRAAAIPAANEALTAALARVGFDVVGVGGGAACDS